MDEFPSRMPVGQKIRIARDYHRPRVSQEKLSILIGENRNAVAAWENERYQPSDRALKKVADFFGIPVDWFHDGQPGRPPTLENPPGLSLGGNPPARRNVLEMQLGVGRRLFPLLGKAGAALAPFEFQENAGEVDGIEFSDDLYDGTNKQFAIQVWGDSMEPDIAHGDFILVTQSLGPMPDGIIVVIRNPEQGYLVKVKQGKELISFHKDYKPIPIEDGWEMVGFATGWRREKGFGAYLEVGGRHGLRKGFRE